MQKLASRALAAGIALALAGTAQADVLISQIYTGTGSTASPYRHQYVELHNTGEQAVSLDAWSLHYTGSTSATATWTRTSLRGSIAPGGYYLIALGSAGTGQAALPTPDLHLGFNPTQSSGRFALSDNARTLTTACPADLRDRVGYGSAPRCNTAAPLALPMRQALLRAGNGCTDTGIDSADFALAAPTPRNSRSPAVVCAGPAPTLSVADIVQDEGNNGSSEFRFTLKLDRPAPAGGVQWRVNTNAVSATPGEDYVEVKPVTGEFPAGKSETSFGVQVFGDVKPEADETFELHVQALTPGVITDGDGVLKATATIRNDDFPLRTIGAVQGRGGPSPLLGQTVAVQGVVTAVTEGGVFVQNEAGDSDGDSHTSDALFVLASAATDPGWIGRRVRASGMVVEHAPDADPRGRTLTALGAATVVQLGAGSLPVPVAIPLWSPDLGADLQQLESMRVGLPILRTVGPSGARSGGGAWAPVLSDGVFQVELAMPGPMPAQTARPQREPGLRFRAPPYEPAGRPDLPLWDGNPQVLSIDSAANGRAPFDVAAGAQVGGLQGVLGLRAGRYTLLLGTEANLAVLSPAPAPRSADEDVADGPTTPTTATATDPTTDPTTNPDQRMSVAFYDLERFFDDADQPGRDEPVLPWAEFDRRVRKAALGIRSSLGAPDVVALDGVESHYALEQLAHRIDIDASSAGEPMPRYQPLLLPGNDPQGLTVAYLIKRAPLPGGQPRVEASVRQVGIDTRWENGDLLFERPPLTLEATVAFADGRREPLELLLLGLSGRGDSEAAGAAGETARFKRQRQAEFLAGYAHERQQQATAYGRPRLVLLGDFDAHPFSDGYVDSANFIAGTPGPDSATSVPADGIDRVDPDLIFADAALAPERRYSSLEQGNAQNLQHALLSEQFVLHADGLQLQHARINADFPATLRNDPATAVRGADSDPLRIAWTPRPVADLRIRLQPLQASARPGDLMRYRLELSNLDPDPARDLGLAVALPEWGNSLQVLPSAEGWSCQPPQSEQGAVSLACSGQELASGALHAFEVVTQASHAMAGRYVPMVASATAPAYDANPQDNQSIAYVEVPLEPAPTP